MASGHHVLMQEEWHRITCLFLLLCFSLEQLLLKYMSGPEYYTCNSCRNRSTTPSNHATLIPIVHFAYKTHHENLIKRLLRQKAEGESIELCGDARSDSPGECFFFSLIHGSMDCKTVISVLLWILRRTRMLSHYYILQATAASIPPIRFSFYPLMRSSTLNYYR